MEIVGNAIAGIEWGNAQGVNTGNTGANGDELAKSGWVVGHSAYLRADSLLMMPQNATADGVCVKWFQHAAGDPNGTGKPLSTGRTISFLANEGGRFQLRFWLSAAVDDKLTVILTEPGDFAVSGPGINHEWEALRDSTIVTVRWSPIVVDAR